MEYIAVAILTIGLSLAIIGLVGKNQNKAFEKVVYRQTDVHKAIKSFFHDNVLTKKPETQTQKRKRDKSIKIVAIEDKAYWVVDNTFYVADLVDDHPDMSTAQPVDTLNMPKSDLDKMLFILDNLDRGKNNERGSTGNE